MNGLPIFNSTNYSSLFRNNIITQAYKKLSTQADPSIVPKTLDLNEEFRGLIIHVSCKGKI